MPLDGIYALYFEGYTPNYRECTLYPLVKRGIVKPVDLKDLLRDKSVTHIILSPFGSYNISSIISISDTKHFSLVIIEAPPTKLEELTNKLNSLSLLTCRLPASIKPVRPLVYHTNDGILFSHNALLSALAYFALHKKCCELLRTICSFKYSIYPCIYMLMFILFNRNNHIIYNAVAECLDQSLEATLTLLASKRGKQNLVG